MATHKARPEDKHNPNTPYAINFAGGRRAKPFAEVDGNPVLGGIQNSDAESQHRSAKEEKDKIHQYHQHREEVKKAAKTAEETKAKDATDDDTKPTETTKK